MFVEDVLPLTRPSQGRQGSGNCNGHILNLEEQIDRAPEQLPSRECAFLDLLLCLLQRATALLVLETHRGELAKGRVWRRVALLNDKRVAGRVRLRLLL